MSMGVESFGSFEEMQQFMAEREDEANADLRDVQIELRDDTEHTRYWVRPFPEGECLIFGEAWSFKQSCDVSASYVEDVPAAHGDKLPSVNDWADYRESLAEAVYEIRTHVSTRERGYLRGKAYSILEPEGEYGDTHVASIMPISEQAFLEAKAAGWRAVQVTPFTLDLIGEEAARKGGWTPTLIKELEALGRQD